MHRRQTHCRRTLSQGAISEEIEQKKHLLHQRHHEMFFRTLLRGSASHITLALSLSLSRSLCLSLLSHNKAREHDWLTWVLFARQVVVVVVVFGGGFVVAFWNQQGVKVVWCKAVWRKRVSGWFWFNSWISTSSVNVKCLSPCRSTLHVTSQRRGYHATSCDIRSCHSLFCAVLECWSAGRPGHLPGQLCEHGTTMNQKRCLWPNR